MSGNRGLSRTYHMRRSETEGVPREHMAESGKDVSSYGHQGTTGRALEVGQRVSGRYPQS